MGLAAVSASGLPVLGLDGGGVGTPQPLPSHDGGSGAKPTDEAPAPAVAKVGMSGKSKLAVASTVTLLGVPTVALLAGKIAGLDPRLSAAAAGAGLVLGVVGEYAASAMHEDPSPGRITAAEAIGPMLKPAAIAGTVASGLMLLGGFACGPELADMWHGSHGERLFVGGVAGVGIGAAGAGVLFGGTAMVRGWQHHLAGARQT